MSKIKYLLILFLLTSCSSTTLKYNSVYCGPVKRDIIGSKYVNKREAGACVFMFDINDLKNWRKSVGK